MKKFISVTDAKNKFAAAGQPKSERRIQEYLAAGIINGRKVGKSWQVNEKSVDQYIKTNNNVRKPPAPETPIPQVEVKSIFKNGIRRYILTAVQDNTELHGEWWSNLQTFADHIGAELLVAPYTYMRRKHRDQFAVEWFDERVQPYLVSNRIHLPGIHFCAEMPIVATAVRPLSALDTYTQSEWACFPHSRVQFQSVATIGKKPAKLVMTTGASTIPNYERKKAGLKAEFHHVIGATLVEIDGNNNIYCRQLIANDAGDFQDLTTLVKDKKIYENQHVEAITWGDIHLPYSKEDHCFEENWGVYDGMLDHLKPRYQFFHDLLDFSARNHHRINDPHHWYSMHVNGSDSVEDEVGLCSTFLRTTQRPWCKSVVVESNHDMALDKWLKTQVPTFDPVNALFWHKCHVGYYEAIKRGEKDFNIFKWVLAQQDSKKLEGIDFVDRNGGYTICNGTIECGIHGHIGLNGARGSVYSFSKMASKMNIGHTHSCQILDGVYVAGISGSLDQGYNHGPSSWSHTDIVTYPTGKRTLVTHQNRKWRA